MDLKWLRSFVVLAEELHFGRAATRVNIVQPALSYQIRQLEQTLGVRLLDRSTRAVALTPAGTLFLREAKQALHHLELAQRGARDAEGGTGGLLRIGFVDNALWSVFVELIREFRARFPRIELDLRQATRTAQAAALADGRLDVGILPGDANRAGLSALTLTESSLMVALPAQHALARHKSIAIKLLDGEKLITFASASDPRRIDEIIASICAAAGFTPTFGQAVEQMHTALALVSAGLGVTIVPGWMRGAWGQGVVYRDLVPATPYVLSLVWAEDAQVPAVESLLATARDFIAARS